MRDITIDPVKQAVNFENAMKKSVGSWMNLGLLKRFTNIRRWWNR